MLYEDKLKFEEELLNRFYNTPINLSEFREFAKADAPILTTTTGFFNPVYGASAYMQLNQSSVLFNALPKFAYQRAGFRARTTRVKNSGVGIGENSLIPDSVKPEKVQVNVGIKEMAMSIEVSQRQLLLSDSKDDVSFDLALELEMVRRDFAYAIDKDINENVTNLASNNIESIDRVVSSYSEVSNCGDLQANDADIYGLNRDAGPTWADAYVNHNNGTTRTISEGIVTDLIHKTLAAGANPSTQIWYTGADTWEQLTRIFQTQIRYSQPSDYKAGTSPATSGEAKGLNFGVELGTLYGRPVYVAPTGKVAASGSEGDGPAISNLYLLDIGTDPIYNEPYLGIKVLMPPMLAQTRLENYPAHGKLGTKILLYAAMELECKRFNIQGKARDLAAAY